MKNILVSTLTLGVIAVLCCFPRNTPVVNSADYEIYLNKTHFEKAQHKLDAQIAFWENKLQAAPENFVYQNKLAGLFSADFKLTGKVRQLHRSDSLLLLINSRIPDQHNVLYNLAANAITKHAFRQAEAYSAQMYRTGEKKFISALLRTDVYLERGNFSDAAFLLNTVASENHFDYLIRKVKVLDQQGNLCQAISVMEKAARLAATSGSDALQNWSLSNLADMYGHYGNIDKSYQTYLQALQFNPADFHALKGIAWIAYAQDKNLAEAKRILNFLRALHPVPDYDLLLADIAEFEKNPVAASNHQRAFVRQADLPEYGNMYKRYICALESTAPERALEIAIAEVAERPHPVSYAFLAWSMYRNGNDSGALEMLKKHVMQQTEEPDALFFAGVILKETGHKKEAEAYLKQASEAGFELGPVMESQIKGYLRDLKGKPEITVPTFSQLSVQ